VQSQEALAELQRRIGITFGRVALLQEALTHPSFANECVEDVADNQRLEFLGDAVIALVASRWLFAQLPDAPEGELTSLRASIVRTESLAAMAQRIDLGRYMRFGHGEEASGGREKLPNLCAAFEALVGAVYLDQGIVAVERWLLPALESQIDTCCGSRIPKDAKSELQEYTQAAFHITPRYELTSVGGPDHARQFTVTVSVGEECWGTGSGSSKRIAQQAAAQQALATHRK